MPCNIAKYRELVAQKKNKTDTVPVNGLKQVNKLKILGVPFQENNRFNEHVKTKLVEANRCSFVLRTLRQEGYMQPDIDSLFAAIVLPKTTYGLSVYAASPPDLNRVQKFLTRTYKRNYISHPVNVSELVEKSGLAIANRICKRPSHPFSNLLPRLKESSLNLRNSRRLLPLLNTERYKSSFLNRLHFQYQFALYILVNTTFLNLDFFTCISNFSLL